MPVARRHSRKAHLVPFGEALLGFCAQTGVAADAHRRVRPRGVLIDEEVVAASGHVVVVDESPAVEEEASPIAQVAARACVGVSHQGAAQIVRTVGQIVVLLKQAEHGVLSVQPAVAQHDFGLLLRVSLHHAAQPLHVLWSAVGVGQQQYIVLRTFDAYGEGVFLALEEVHVLAERHHLQVGIVVLEQLEHEPGVVAAQIVHHNHLEVRVVLFEQIDQVFLEPFGVVVSRQHHAHRRQRLLRALRSRGVALALALPEAHAEMDHPVIQAANRQRREHQHCEYNRLCISQKMRKVEHLCTIVLAHKNTYYLFMPSRPAPENINKYSTSRRCPHPSPSPPPVGTASPASHHILRGLFATPTPYQAPTNTLSSPTVVGVG